MIFSYMSAIGLGISGLFITIVGMLFSVKGLTLWLPSPEWYITVVMLAIAFEVAKLATSTFLFHYIKDSEFPLFFKGFLTFATIGLVVVSSASIFVHLTEYASSKLNLNVESASIISKLESRNTYLQESKLKLDDQINNVPADRITARMRMYESFRSEKERIDKEIESNNVQIKSLQSKISTEDEFAFLNGISKITTLSREVLYTIFILFLVSLIDPLAIALVIASSFLFASINKAKLGATKTTVVHDTITIDKIHTEEETIVPNVPIIEPIIEEIVPVIKEEVIVESIVEEVTEDKQIVIEPIIEEEVINIEPEVILEAKEEKIIETVSFDNDNVSTTKKRRVLKKVKKEEDAPT